MICQLFTSGGAVAVAVAQGSQGNWVGNVYTNKPSAKVVGGVVRLFGFASFQQSRGPPTLVRPALVAHRARVRTDDAASKSESVL